MVIQESSKKSLEVTITPKTMSEKKFVIVKNHVRELGVSADTEIKCAKESLNPEILVPKEQDSTTIQVASTKPEKRRFERQESKEQCSNTDSEISASDIDELRTVYNKCKVILQKIESKYGHLLNLDSDSVHSTNKRKKVSSKKKTSSECHCTLNKKIVFDDEGQEIATETTFENHICPKIKCTENVHINNNVNVEYESCLPLTNNLIDLTEMLKDPNISSTCRRRVIYRIKNIRQENMNIIKFDKHSLVQKLKSDPDDIVDFKGSNISRLSGYPIVP